MTPYPKRLIEVDLPIARISAHARREKSIRHGHISTLHIWWARRPLAACRAVILASLWPDPVDLTEWLRLAEEGGQSGVNGPDIRAPKFETLKAGEGVSIRPNRFLDEARAQMLRWAKRCAGKVSELSCGALIRVQKDASLLDDPEFLRTVLLDFIADFANWDNSIDPDYLATSRALVQAAHETLGGEAGTRPLVIDPFAGGGSIPLEVLRVGGEPFASDLNPIPVLLNKVVLEYIPKYGQQLADEVRTWGEWVLKQAAEELAELYPQDPDGSTPIAYLWARTILSEAPGQGTLPVEIPLLRSMWLCKKAARKRAFRWVRDKAGKVKTKTVEVVYCIDGQETTTRIKRPMLEVFEPLRDADVEPGTSARGRATCPVTGFTTSVERVREVLASRHGGAHDARLVAVVLAASGSSGRTYRAPSSRDHKAVDVAAERYLELSCRADGGVPIFPDEEFTGTEPRRIPLPQYGIRGFRDLFGRRQMLAITTLLTQIRRAIVEQRKAAGDRGLAEAVATLLAIVLDRQIDKLSSLTRWDNTRENPQGTFGRQALPMVWDFNEVSPFSGAGGDWATALAWVVAVIEREVAADLSVGQAASASATNHPLPNDAAHAMVTDPPYYYSVPYSDLSDFFYVWLRRSLGDVHPDLFADALTPKSEECVQNLPHRAVQDLQKSRAFYESTLGAAFAEGRRVVAPSGIAVVVFAHSDTEAWEASLGGLVSAGWCVTGSWPIDTEMANRTLAVRQSTLASSVHLVCRPRENVSGDLLEDSVGEWRQVIREMPQRVAAWMPRLASEGVVGADAIFACLGPALEIFSRYSRVEKSSGEEVTLREYLEQVWAAVSNEALSMIFKDADAAGLEPDARLTAMWLWTIGGGKPQDDEDVEAVSEDDSTSTKAAGFTLEFDAARKIAQGLGIHLDKSASFVEVKGDKARLLPVAERVQHLFGKDAADESATGRRQKKKPQLGLFEELEAIEAEADEGNSGRFGGLDAANPSSTVLDKAHQSMVLFASGRGEALRRFLVDDGIGKDARFWKLAQALSALYPQGTDEKRWVDGVLARKKGLGL